MLSEIKASRVEQIKMSRKLFCDALIKRESEVQKRRFQKATDAKERVQRTAVALANAQTEAAVAREELARVVLNEQAAKMLLEREEPVQGGV